MIRNILVTLSVVTSVISFSGYAKVSEERMIKYEEKISMSDAEKQRLIKLQNDIYSRSVDTLYSKKYWGAFGTFDKISVETQGSLAYGMALSDSSDLDIAFVYKYNDGSSMGSVNAYTLKKVAVDAFTEVFGGEYNYSIKAPVVNLSNGKDDVDIAFFNQLKDSRPSCSNANRCSELAYGNSIDTGSWYLSERLSLYSVFDKEFTVGTSKRQSIDRAGKILKTWRKIRFSQEKNKVPSIALVTLLYDFNKSHPVFKYENTIESLTEITQSSIVNVFGSDSCEKAATAEIDLPVYQADRNLLGKLTGSEKELLCTEMVLFKNALSNAVKPDVDEDTAAKILEKYIGKI